MERWSNKVALVTGASSGIGAAICKQLLKHGMKVIGCARNIDRIKAIIDDPEMRACKGTLLPIKCDLTKEDEILSMFDCIRKKYGRIDVCINNAGLSTQCPLLSGKTEDWRHIFEVNILALCICTRESINLMKEKNIDDGQIINISSLAGHVVLDFDFAYYGGTKFMVNALTEGLRKELRTIKSHIRVCSISPGLVETEFVMRFSDGNEALNDAFYKKHEVLQADDIATAVTSVLQAPPHVDINNVLVRPTEQQF